MSFLVNPYWFAVAECTESIISNKTTGTTTYISSPANASIIGTKILSGNSLIGESLNELTFNVKRDAGTSGNIVIGRVPNSVTDGSFASTMVTEAVGDNIGTSYADVTFSGTGGTIAANDILGIKFTGSGGDIDVSVNDATPNMANQEIRYLDGTTWTNNGYYILGTVCTS